MCQDIYASVRGLFWCAERRGEEDSGQIQSVDHAEEATPLMLPVLLGARNFTASQMVRTFL